MPLRALALVFITFFSHFELGHFSGANKIKRVDSGYLVCATPTILCRSFQNITDVFVMILRYACGLDINFDTFSAF